MGVMAYVAAPLWMLLLFLSTAEAIRARLAGHAYFAPEGSLFPIWKVSIERQSAMLFGAVFALLFVPRALAVIARLADREERAGFGGASRLVLSSAVECFFSMLLAPILAFDQARCVLGIVRGKSVGWPAQQRGDKRTPWTVALRRHGGVTLVGVLWAWLLFDLAPEIVPWMAPVLVGMIGAVPLSQWSSRASAGAWARRRGLLWTPEETSPPPVLEAAREERTRTAKRASPADSENALARVLRDPEARAVHIAFLDFHQPIDPLEAHAIEGLVLKCRLHGPGALDEDEQRAVLHSAIALEELIASSPTRD